MRLPISPPARRKQKRESKAFTAFELPFPIGQLGILACNSQGRRLAPDLESGGVHGRQGQQGEHGGNDQPAHDADGHRPPENAA